jgi:hypothetical protein
MTPSRINGYQCAICGALHMTLPSVDDCSHDPVRETMPADWVSRGGWYRNGRSA